MIQDFSLKNPWILPDYENNVYYCYGDGGLIYSSKDLSIWEKLSSDMPFLNQTTVIKTKNEYRLYNAEDEGIVLYVSAHPADGFKKRDIVISAADITSDISLSHPSVFADPVSKEHYLVYGCDKNGIYVLHINPRNGLAHEEGAGTRILAMPDFNNHVTDGFIFYNEEDSLYYLFASYGGEHHSSIRVCRSSTVQGTYTDYAGREMTDLNNFEDSLGMMVLAPMHFDDCSYVESCFRPILFKDFNQKIKMLYNAYITPEDVYNGNTAFSEPILNLVITDVLSYNNAPILPIPYGLKSSSDSIEQLSKASEICGNYELVKLNKEFPLSLADYNNLSVLGPREQGVSSTRNSWALSIPHKVGGRTELGGSLRGFWIFSDDEKLHLRYNNSSEEYIAIKANTIETNVDSVLLLGVDNNGTVSYGKKYN